MSTKSGLINNSAFNANLACSKLADTFADGSPSVMKPCFAKCGQILAGIAGDADVPKDKAHQFNACTAECDKLNATPQEDCYMDLDKKQNKNRNMREARFALVIGIPAILFAILVGVLLIMFIRKKGDSYGKSNA